MRGMVAALIGLAILGPAAVSPSLAAGMSAAERMALPGPEQAMLEEQTGEWDVLASLWPAPGAQPIVTRGLVAERRMVGPILQEVMKPAPGSEVPDFTRIDYLDFDRVEGRWKYVSMDTRFPVSIMPARSFGPAVDGKIDVQFEPQGFVGFGPDVEGRFMLSDMAISEIDADHMLKEQHVMMANGTGESWLFVRYEYSRHH